MNDPQIHKTIEQLVAEEHAALGSARPPATAEREPIGGASGELKVSLDQCWDLLRQRRALRDAGRDPEAAAADVRRPDVVEHYEQ